MNLLRESFPNTNATLGTVCRYLAAMAITIGLAGCDDGTKTSSGPSSMEARIEGNIQDQHGPIMNSRLEVTDKNGRAVQNIDLTNSNHYNIKVPAGTAYPIVLTASPVGESATNSTPVKAVITSPLADRMDVTDVSTIVVESALSLGGLTAENIAKASGAAIGLRQREGVSAGAGGGGAGPGQSGGGVSRGGHGGHGAPAESGGRPADSAGGQSPHSMPGSAAPH